MSEKFKFDIAEKNSYAKLDNDSYAKLVVTASNVKEAADPLDWSYAETHSYVQVAPSSLSLAVPEGTDEVYAKVVYIPNLDKLFDDVKDEIFIGQTSADIILKNYLSSELNIELNKKHDLITNSNKLDFGLISGMTSIEISNSDFDNFIVKDSNLTLGSLSAISITGDNLQVNLGIENTLSGVLAYAHGQENKALGKLSVADGFKNETIADVSHAEGVGTIAYGYSQHVEGKYNVPNSKYQHITGGGSGHTNRKNIQTLDWQGNEWLAGELSASDFIAGTNVLSKKVDKISGYSLIADTEIERLSTVSGFDPNLLSGKIREILGDSIISAEIDPLFASVSGKFAEVSNIFNITDSKFGGFSADLTINQVVTGMQLVKDVVTSFQFDKRGTILQAGDSKYIVTQILVSPNVDSNTSIEDYGNSLEYLGFYCVGQHVDLPASVKSAMSFLPNIAIPSAIIPNIDKVVFLYSKTSNRTYTIYADTSLADNNIQSLVDHLSDSDSHVSETDRENWNSKIGAYNLPIDSGESFFSSNDIAVSSLIAMNPVIIATFDNKSVEFPNKILSSSNVTANNLITREIWIGVPSGSAAEFDTSILSDNYDLIGNFPGSILSGSTTKKIAYYIFVLRFNTKGQIGAELSFSHTFNTNGDF